jgi:hypothetical protein
VNVSETKSLRLPRRVFTRGSPCASTMNIPRFSGVFYF